MTFYTLRILGISLHINCNSLRTEKNYILQIQLKINRQTLTGKNWHEYRGIFIQDLNLFI